MKATPRWRQADIHLLRRTRRHPPAHQLPHRRRGLPLPHSCRPSVGKPALSPISRARQPSSQSPRVIQRHQAQLHYQHLFVHGRNRPPSCRHLPIRLANSAQRARRRNALSWRKLRGWTALPRVEGVRHSSTRRPGRPAKSPEFSRLIRFGRPGHFGEHKAWLKPINIRGVVCLVLRPEIRPPYARRWSAPSWPSGSLCAGLRGLALTNFSLN